MPFSTNAHILCALEGELDLIRIGARGDDQVVFELALVAVIGEVNAGIDVLVPDLGVGRDIRPPLLRVVAEEVIDDAGQRL